MRIHRKIQKISKFKSEGRLLKSFLNCSKNEAIFKLLSFFNGTQLKFFGGQREKKKSGLKSSLEYGDKGACLMLMPQVPLLWCFVSFFLSFCHQGLPLALFLSHTLLTRSGVTSLASFLFRFLPEFFKLSQAAACVGTSNKIRACSHDQ